MSKQNIPLHLKKAIWYAYDKRSGYEGQPISFTEMEIDHIIPERVSLKPKLKLKTSRKTHRIPRN